MEQWLARQSKFVLAIGSVLLGVIFIIMVDRPKSVCDAQKTVFESDHTGFLYLDPKDKTTKITGIQKYSDICRSTNGPGGCYEFFQRLGGLAKDLKRMPQECQSDMMSLPEVREALWDNLELMVRIAWGSKPSTTVYEKHNWLDEADLGLFCDLSKLAKTHYGKAQWVEFRERLLTELPGAQNVPRKEAWEAIIFSTKCR